MKKLMKTGKEFKINDFDKVNIIYGSVNNKIPKSLYIGISSWAEPREDVDDHNRVIKNTHKNIRQLIYNFLLNKNDVFTEKNFIVDFDLKESGIKLNKRSFVDCEITLFMNNELSVTSNIVKKTIDELLVVLYDKVFDKNVSFEFHKKKKDKIQ